jgi:hypothetical protein
MTVRGIVRSGLLELKNGNALDLQCLYTILLFCIAIAASNPSSILIDAGHAAEGID